VDLEQPARITAAMCAQGRSFGEVRLSPDGSAVALVSSSAGYTALSILPAAGGTEVVVTTDPAPRRGVGTFDWTPGGDAVVYVGSDGSLHHQPVAGGPSRRLVRTEQASAPAVSPDGTRVAYVVDQHHVALAWLDPSGPWPVRLSGPADFCVDPVWSPDGAVVAWHTWDVPAMAWDDSRVAVADVRSGRLSRVPLPGPAPAAQAGVDGRVAVSQPRFAPDGSGLGFLCDAGGWLNLWQVGSAGLGLAGLGLAGLGLAGPALGAPSPGGALRPVVADDHEHGGPTWGAGQRTWVWSPDGGRVAFCRNEEGFGCLCVADATTGEVTEIDRGVFSSLTWAGDRLAALRSGARTPDQVVGYRVAGGVVDPASRTTLARGPVLGFESAGLVDPEVVSWPGEDRPGIGSVVHGRLLRSERRSPWTEPDAPPPLIVWVHGGPTDQSRVRFHPRSAFFLDRGWNVLQVDPRGSTGWGRAYAQALCGEWGRLDVEDIAEGIRAAVARGWGDRRRVVVMGGSSGGLAVLAVLGRHRGLCAAGVDLYGVTDLAALEETTHRYEAHYPAVLVGPLPACAERYRDRSPLSFAAGITAPLLVLHGTDDRTVPPAQSDALVAALRAAGGTVEHHRFEGEGHGWSRPDSVRVELELIDAFLTRHVLRGVGRRPEGPT
jgi:dipeptidyl aminopeptidase/acylaminoacyl peptidase